jgi:hypothetical protein
MQPAKPPLNNPTAQSNQEVINKLQDERDQLRAIHQTKDSPKKSIFYKASLSLFGVLILAAVLYTLVLPTTKPDPIPKQQNFALPQDLNNKTDYEQTALKIINLARSDQASKIYTDYLSDGSKVSVKEADFSDLISKYSYSADGSGVELVEKKEETISLPSQSNQPLKAVSLIYKSSFFGYQNNIYLKLNLFQDPANPANWKIYLLQFKAGSNQAESGLSADLAIPAQPTQQAGPEQPAPAEEQNQPAPDPNDETSL